MAQNAKWAQKESLAQRYRNSFFFGFGSIFIFPFLQIFADFWRSYFRPLQLLFQRKLHFRQCMQNLWKKIIILGRYSNEATHHHFKQVIVFRVHGLFYWLVLYLHIFLLQTRAKMGSDDTVRTVVINKDKMVVLALSDTNEQLKNFVTQQRILKTL